MTTAEILENAFQLVENEETWTRGTCARDKYGSAVPSHSRNAASWCSVGAVRRVSENLNLGVIDLGDSVPEQRALNILDSISGSGIVWVNDSESRNLLLDVWRRAIRQAHELEATPITESLDQVEDLVTL